MSKENLKDLVLKPKAPEKLQLTGYTSYRILRHNVLAQQLNYMQPGIEGQR